MEPILHEEQVALTPYREIATERFAAESYCYGFEMVKDGTQQSQERSVEQNKPTFGTHAGNGEWPRLLSATTMQRKYPKRELLTLDEVHEIYPGNASHPNFIAKV